MLERETLVNRQQSEIDSLRHSQSSQHSFIQSLQQRLEESEQQLNGYREVHSRGEVTITTIQQENKRQQEDILKLESRLRHEIYAFQYDLTELCVKVDICILCLISYC